MDGNYYSFMRPGVKLIAIDTNIFPSSEYKNKKSKGQLDWLNQQLVGQGQWKIVYGHVPIISHGRHGEKDLAHISSFKKSIIDALCNNFVDFYVAGHDHHLEIDKVSCDNGHMLTSIVTGAGGQMSGLAPNIIKAGDPELLWANGVHFNNNPKDFAKLHAVGFAHIALIDDSQAIVRMMVAKSDASTVSQGNFHVQKGRSITPIH